MLLLLVSKIVPHILEGGFMLRYFDMSAMYSDIQSMALSPPCFSDTPKIKILSTRCAGFKASESNKRTPAKAKHQYTNTAKQPQ